MNKKNQVVEENMKVSTLLKFTAIFGFLFGIGYLLFPKQLLTFFGVDFNESTLMTARFFGGAIIGYGVLAWSARNTEDLQSRRSIKLAIFMTCLIALVLSVISWISNFFTAFAWIPVVFFILITAAFGYFRFIKPKEEN